MIDSKQIDKTDWNDNTFIDGLGNEVDIDIFNPLQPTTYVVIRKKTPPYEYVFRFNSQIFDGVSGQLDGREHKVVIANIEKTPVEINADLSEAEYLNNSVMRVDIGTVILYPGQIMTIKYFWVLLDVNYLVISYVIT